jgi:hypothetical protein
MLSSSENEVAEYLTCGLAWWTRPGRNYGTCIGCRSGEGYVAAEFSQEGSPTTRCHFSNGNDRCLYVLDYLFQFKGRIQTSQLEAKIWNLPMSKEKIGCSG